MIRDLRDESYTLIGNDTGEIALEDFRFPSNEDKKRGAKYYEKEEDYELFKDFQARELGDFVFFMFGNIDRLVEILNNNELSRFVYLGTFVKSDGTLRMDNNKAYIDKKKMRSLLRINDKTFRELYNKLIEENLLVEDGNNIKIDLDYFYKGHEENYKEITGRALKDFTRLYVVMIRDLYENTHSRSTGKLSILYKLIPLINWRHNVLCERRKDTLEVDKYKIKALTIAHIMDITGYKKNRLAQFKKDFYSLEYNDNKIFGSFQKQPEYMDSIIVVNPKFLYRGNSIKDIERIIELFEVEVEE